MIIQSKDKFIGLDFLLGKRYIPKESDISFDCLLGFSFNAMIEKSFFKSPLQQVNKPLPIVNAKNVFFINMLMQFKINYNLNNFSCLQAGTTLSADLFSFGNNTKTKSLTSQFITSAFFFGVAINLP